MPKPNMYQSLHTKVFGPDGRLVEIQIRTEEMNRTAEIGIAAHWRYKEGKAAPDEIDAHAKWLRQLLDWQKEATTSQEFMEDLKINLFQDEIFVFTPLGRLITLPKGSTPIDFAFAVHSDIGLHAIGAKVNGKIAPLPSHLASGDSVEIITSANQKPSLDWLKFVKTTRARSRIKKYFREAQFQESVSLGSEIIHRELGRMKIKKNDGELKDVAVSFGHSNVDELFAAVGAGDLSVQNVIRKLIPDETDSTASKNVIEWMKRRLKRDVKGVRVQGLDNMMLNFAKCCRPLPGDKITGFITTGQGITIHRTDCRNIEHLLGDPEKNISVEWDVDKDTHFNARIRIISEDRKRLLRDITDAVAKQNVNIMAIDMKISGAMAVGDFILEVHNLPHLIKIIRNIRNIKGVVNVERLDHLGDEDLLVESESLSKRNSEKSLREQE
jgi:GTP pyrophosphokinase